MGIGCPMSHGLPLFQRVLIHDGRMLQQVSGGHHLVWQSGSVIALPPVLAHTACMLELFSCQIFHHPVVIAVAVSIDPMAMLSPSLQPLLIGAVASLDHDDTAPSQ